MFKFEKKDILLYLKRIPNFPQYQIDEFLALKFKLERLYVPIESKKQIQVLINLIHNHSATFNRYSALNLESDLIEVMSKFMDKDFHDQVRLILRPGKHLTDDDNVYKMLRELKAKHRSKRSLLEPRFLPNAAEIVAQNLAYSLGEYIKEDFKYLDLGAGSGYKTRLISQYLKLDFKNVYAIDYKKFDDREYERVKELNFATLENNQSKLPYEDQSFDFASCLMVLHHITDDKDLDFTLIELKRVLKKGGYLLIKEHNCISVSDKLLSDVEHCMYEIVNTKTPNYDFRTVNYSRYFSWVEWDIILRRYGLIKIEMSHMPYSIYDKINASKHYFALYRSL